MIYQACILLLFVKTYRVFEALLIVAVTTSSVFIAATFLGTCIRENNPTLPDNCPDFVSPSVTTGPPHKLFSYPLSSDMLSPPLYG